MNGKQRAATAEASAADVQCQPWVTVSCPHCGTAYEVEQSECGGSAICQVCNNEFVVGQREMNKATVENTSKEEQKDVKFCSGCGVKMPVKAAFCPKCRTPVNGKQRATNEVVPSASGSEKLRRPKIPGITLTACIILYVILGAGLVGALSESGKTPVALLAGVVGIFLLIIACVVYAHLGRNWARIVLTAVFGFVSLKSFLEAPIFGIMQGVILAIPFTFLWLPRSNNWYRAIKSLNR